RLAFPVSLAYILSMSNQIFSMIFIGHLGTTELAAAAMGLMYTNLVGFSLGLGLTTAVDTLASQAHTASDNPEQALARILVQSVLILLLLAIPLSFLFYAAEPLLRLLKQDPEISRLAGVWSAGVVPA
ncbi:hypothetical protein HDU93_005621, partial [Gonapodya sp. JEL0774]